MLMRKTSYNTKIYSWLAPQGSLDVQKQGDHAAGARPHRRVEQRGAARQQACLRGRRDGKPGLLADSGNWQHLWGGAASTQALMRRGN